MKKLILTITISILFGNKSVEYVDGVAAIIEEHIILKSDLAQMVNMAAIQNKIDPGEAAVKDLYDLTAKEESKIPQVAATLPEALEALKKDRKFLTQGGVFSDDFLDSFIDLKMEEVTRLRMTPHPVEFDMYYSV